MEMLSKEIDMIEKRSIIDRISKLEKIVMKYSDIKKKSEVLESVENKVIMVKSIVELIENSFDCDRGDRGTNNEESVDYSKEVDLGNDKIEYLKEKMNTINKTLELAEKRMVVDRITNIENNVEILCKVDTKIGRVDIIEEEIERITIKIDLIEKRLFVDRIKKLDKHIEVLSQLEKNPSEAPEKDKIGNLKRKMESVNKKFDLIEKMLVFERITKLEKDTVKLNELEKKIEKIEVLESKINNLQQKIDLAEKAFFSVK